MDNANKYLKSVLGRTTESLKRAYLTKKRICFLVGSDQTLLKDIVCRAAILPNHMGDTSPDNDTPPTPTVAFVSSDNFVKPTISAQTEFGQPRIFVYICRPHYNSATNSLDENDHLPLTSLANFADVCSGLADSNMRLTPGNRRTLRYMQQSMIIVAVKSRPDIPPYIEPFSATITVPYMDEDECSEFISEFLAVNEGASLTTNADGYDTVANSDLLSTMYHSFRGMTQQQIHSILADCHVQLGQIYREADDEGYKTHIDRLKKCIRRHSDRIVENSRALIIENPSDNEPAGLANLSDWLKRHRDQVARPYSYAQLQQEAPKGILVSGVPGSGKSMMAKFVAGCFRLSLVRLDFGNLGGSYVGQSEKNMDSALAKIEALSPCVLWVDEIEKAFSGASGNSSSDVTKRLFGKFLTWMQEKGNRGVSCFVFATANDISLMPPEMFRSGRFDDKFFTFMPSADDCGRIFESIIKAQTKRSREYNRSLQARPLFNTSAVNAALFVGLLNDRKTCLKGWPDNELSDRSVNRRNKFFTGADIEQTIKKAKNLYINGFAEDIEATGDAEFDSTRFAECLKEAIGQTKTYGETNLADIARCYAMLAVNNFNNAASDSLLPFDGYDELSYTSAEPKDNCRLYDLDRNEKGREERHYSRFAQPYDRCLYIIVRNTINNTAKDITRQRW